MIVIPRRKKNLISDDDLENCKKVTQEEIMSSLTLQEMQILGTVKPETIQTVFDKLGIESGKDRE